MNQHWKTMRDENRAKAAEYKRVVEEPPDENTNGVTLMFYADNPLANTPSAWSIGDKPQDPQELAVWNEVLGILKAVPVSSELYPEVFWDVHATSFNCKGKVWPFIDKQGGVHTLSMEDFENHPSVVLLMNRESPTT